MNKDLNATNMIFMQQMGKDSQGYSFSSTWIAALTSIKRAFGAHNNEFDFETESREARRFGNQARRQATVKVSLATSDAKEYNIQLTLLYPDLKDAPRGKHRVVQNWRVSNAHPQSQLPLEELHHIDSDLSRQIEKAYLQNREFKLPYSHKLPSQLQAVFQHLSKKYPGIAKLGDAARKYAQDYTMELICRPAVSQQLKGHYVFMVNFKRQYKEKPVSNRHEATFAETFTMPQALNAINRLQAAMQFSPVVGIPPQNDVLDEDTAEKQAEKQSKEGESATTTQGLEKDTQNTDDRVEPPSNIQDQPYTKKDLRELFGIDPDGEPPAGPALLKMFARMHKVLKLNPDIRLIGFYNYAQQNATVTGIDKGDPKYMLYVINWMTNELRRRERELHDRAEASVTASNRPAKGSLKEAEDMVRFWLSNHADPKEREDMLEHWRHEVEKRKAKGNKK